MKAKEAIELMNSAKAINMKPIYDKIKLAAQSGKSSCFHNERLNELQVKELRDNGYIIKDLTDRDGVLIDIIWSVVSNS